MVVRNGQENVMGDVSTNVVVDVIDESVVAIDGGQCPFQEVPIFAPIPRNVVFSVVQERHQIQPHYKNDIGSCIVLQQRHPAKLVRHPAQESHHSQPPHRANQHIGALLRFK